ncbi:energy-coupling factor transporter transmembrane component T family protein [Gracilibacillus dipsosauri]|uniref:Energy-coupling factor transporter transmembrane protein EcfT n=1 Tax=Gracilibacillus dipsosauri TaxID=178340 RepID=A0A317KV98_9BACI|nr:energy-coupling factor transporter transmembrane component T [Gracilibacillus dipsosauri]PWU67442.1 transporter [Gracilibacillus dipsosauri]
MKSFMVIGQYVPSRSPLHLLDPRFKLLFIFGFVFIVFLANNAASYALLTIYSFSFIILSRLHIRYVLKGIAPIWFFILFSLLFHLFFTKEGELLYQLGFISIYDGGLIKGVTISLRFLLLIMVTSLLTLTTTPMEITDGIEALLKPLKKWKVPVHELALMISISLRFIPTLMDELEKISKAQASRGVDFKTGSWKSRIYAVIPLLVPLFISAFKRAENLAIAMEARGYRGDVGRTKLRKLQMTKLDYMAIFVVLALAGLFFWIRE